MSHGGEGVRKVSKCVTFILNGPLGLQNVFDGYPPNGFSKSINPQKTSRPKWHLKAMVR